MKRDAWLPFGRTEGDEDTPSIDTTMPISQQRPMTLLPYSHAYFTTKTNYSSSCTTTQLSGKWDYFRWFHTSLPYVQLETFLGAWLALTSCIFDWLEYGIIQGNVYHCRYKVKVSWKLEDTMWKWFKYQQLYIPISQIQYICICWWCYIFPII